MTDVPPQDPFNPPGGTPPPPPPPPQMPPQNTAPQPGAYYSNQQGYSASGGKTDPFAITSMVTGIVSVPFICCWPIGIVIAIVATVFGGLSMSKIGKSNGNLGGKGMAIAGLVLGILVILAIIGIVVVAAASGNLEFNTYNN